MNKCFLFLVIIVVSYSANASFLIDPYIGTGLIKTTFDETYSDDDDTLTSVGARLGYQVLLVSAGIDYSKGKSGNYEFTNTSLFAGVDLPILIRAWVEYFISSDLSSNNSRFSSVDFEFKRGRSIGFGFTGLPFVSLNLEVQTIEYEADAIVDIDFDSAAYIFSISLPLNL
jgi:hypothetical protein